MKLYDKVREILKSQPETRDSDKKLVWATWHSVGLIPGYISREIFMLLPSSDSITRASRMIKKAHPELQGNKLIILAKKKKELERGTFVFREQLTF